MMVTNCGYQLGMGTRLTDTDFNHREDNMDLFASSWLLRRVTPLPNFWRKLTISCQTCDLNLKKKLYPCHNLPKCNLQPWPSYGTQAFNQANENLYLTHDCLLLDSPTIDEEYYKLLHSSDTKLSFHLASVTDLSRANNHTIDVSGYINWFVAGIHFC